MIFTGNSNFHTQFVRHMQAILFKTFLDEGHEEVDATVMGAHAGEEEESMFEAIARSGMEVRILLVCCSRK